MIELDIVSTGFAVISAFLAWVAYCYLRSDIKIFANVETTGNKIFLKILLINIGGKSVFVDTKQSFLIVKIGNNSFTRYNINFKNTLTNEFSEEISCNGGEVYSSFEFIHPIKISDILIKDKFSNKKWKYSSRKIKNLNKFLRTISGADQPHS
ncbi:MAG: hypothetical protein ACD_19C00056G0002 [uncultured bacterium]|nr:MAG: hypothetical protein ACD_19C00056G0002 [uncultured bacterium]